MAKDWNKQGFFSGITEDYSNYRWFKGESETLTREIRSDLWQLNSGSMREISTWIIWIVLIPA